MAPGSPLLHQPSPSKKSSQELPLFPHFSSRMADEPLPANGVNGASHLLTIPEPSTETDLTPSLIADEMDVDNGAAIVAEPTASSPSTGAAGGATATRAQQQQQQQQLPLLAPQPSTSRAQRSPVRTPELQTALPQRHASVNGHGTYANGHHQSQSINQPPHQQRGASQARESSPGTIPPFDWEEFEARYENALSDMNGEEKELLEEFDRLVNYFNIWASAASSHDDERAVKRLQTRERYVKIAEQSLGQRKQHLTEVVRAFQSALALLSQS